MATYEVNKGETSTGITLNSNDVMTVLARGTAVKTTVNGGDLIVSEGGIASNTAVQSGSVTLMDGGSAVEMDVNDILMIMGGSATRATVFSGGTAEIDGYTDRLKVALDGVANLNSDGFASTTTIAQGGVMFVHGGTAVGIDVMSSGSFIQTEIGGVLKGLNVNGGYAEIKGELHSTTVCSGGTARISSGAMIFDTVISSGGKITGTVQVNRGALTFVEGGILDFDISGANPSNEALVTNYWLISGTPECTLTVSDSPVYGTYQLADNASDFDRTITVLNTADEVLGTLSVGRGSLSIGNASYSLALDNSILTVTVAAEGGPSKTLDAPVVYASTNELTNGDVYLIATFDDAAAVNQYSLDERSWNEYAPGMNGVPFSANGVAYFRSLDADGSVSPTTTYEVTNIDKVPPDAPVISVESSATSGGVLVSATFSKDSAIQEYSFEGRKWMQYEGAITVTESGTAIFFRATDAAGNESYAEYKEENFPGGGGADDGLDAPVAYADTLELTNGDVYVTAIFDADAAVNQYSTDGGRAWETYAAGMNGVPFSENGIVIFRSLDAAGNISPLTTFEVSNIDKIAPDAPVVTSETAATFEGVLLSATFSEDSVTQEYSFDSKRWTPYNGAITVTEFGTVVFFRATDAAGNESYAEYQVGDFGGGGGTGETGETGLTAPVAYADTLELTNGNVYVTAIFDADATVNQYSTDGGRAWETYAAGMNGVPFSENGIVIFRSLDAAGNISPLTTFEVSNIDKIAPDAPVVTSETAATFEGVLLSATFSEDSVTQEYSFEGKRWIAYNGAITVTEPGTMVLFRAVDAAGNETITEYQVGDFGGGGGTGETGETGLTAPIAVAGNTEPTNQNVYVTARFDTAAAVNEYSLDGQTWLPYPVEPVFTGGPIAVKMTENGTVYFRSADAAGNYSAVTECKVENIDKVAPEAPYAYANITELTNKPVTVFARFSDDFAVRSYSLVSTGVWAIYDDSGVVLTENDTVLFAGNDAAGNYSEMTTFVVSNIDTTPPTAPVASMTTADSFEGALVSAVFSDDSVTQEYSLDGRTWQAYQDAVPVREVGMVVYFRGTDAAGNVSDVTECKVESFVFGPAAPVATASITDPTKFDVSVTATFAPDAALNQYSLNSLDWFDYMDAIVLSENGVVYFRSLDATGVSSAITTYKVENIDKVPPEAPTAFADITEPTNGPVTVYVSYSNDSVVRTYSLASTGLWYSYEHSPLVLTSNDTIYFAAEDAAGNYSPMTTFVVSNIDTTPPTAPVASMTTADSFEGVLVSAEFSDDSVTKEYSLDGRIWQAYQDAIPVDAVGTVVYFRAKDAVGNVSDVTECKVESLVIGPDAPVAQASTVMPTNQDVTVTAMFAPDAVLNQYSLNSLDWFDYTDAIVLSENGVVYFRSLDAEGRSSALTSLTVENIDKVAPDAPYAYADNTAPTNQNVTVFARFSEDSNEREYSIGGSGLWFPYSEIPTEWNPKGGILLTENDTVYFRAADEAGNVSVTTFIVSNIDKVAPEKPTVTVTAANLPAGKGLNVAGNFSEDTVKQEYSLDGRTWEEYNGAITVTEVGKTVYFRGTDAAGNVSDVTTYEVTKLTLGPAAPVASASIIDPTNEDVMVFATFSDDIATKEYSLDGRTWYQLETEGVILRENGSVWFRGTDAEGNVSDVTQYDVTNIDKVAPVEPVVSASTTEATFDPVTVTATFSDDSVVRQYSYDGRENWMDYPEDGITFEKNGYVFFRGIDAAGNVSDLSACNVSNILEVEPDDATADDGWNDVVYDKSAKAFTAAAGEVYSYDLSLVYWYLSGITVGGVPLQMDKFGSISAENDMTNAAGGFRIVGKKKEADVDFARVTVDGPGEVSFTVNSTAAVIFTLYTFTADPKGKVSVKKAQSKFNAGTNHTDKYLLTNADENTQYYISVESAKKGTTAFYNVNLNYNDSMFYYQGNNEDDWTDMKEQGEKGHVGDLGALEDRFVEGEYFDDGALVTDWVGFGDYVDCFKFTLVHAAKLRFAVTSTDAVSFSLSTLAGSPGKYKLNSVMKETALKDGARIDEDEYVFVDGYKYALTTKDVLLDAGTYYIAVADKGFIADYVVDVGGTIFLKANNKDDGVQFRKSGSLLDIGSLGLISDSSIGKTIDEDWVGYGDVVDYKYFILSNPAKLNFTISATDSVKLTVFAVKEKKGKYSFSAFSKNVATITNKSGDSDFYGTASTGSIFLNGEAGTTYCVCVESTNAKKGGDADYSIVLDSDGTSFLPVWKDPFGVDNTGLMIKTKGMHGGTVEIIDIDQWAKDSTFANGLKGYTGWVGYGDAVDTLGFTIPANTPINQISIRSTDEVTFTLSQVIRSGKTGYKTKTIISSTKLTSSDPIGDVGYTYEFNSVALNGSSKKAKDLGAGDYIIIVKSTNAAKGGNANYTVILRSEALTTNADALSMPEESALQLGFAETCADSACGLSMPETDSLAMTDSLSIGRSADALADASAASLAELDGKSAWQNMLA